MLTCGNSNAALREKMLVEDELITKEEEKYAITVWEEEKISGHEIKQKHSINDWKIDSKGSHNIPLDNEANGKSDNNLGYVISFARNCSKSTFDFSNFLITWNNIELMPEVPNNVKIVYGNKWIRENEFKSDFEKRAYDYLLLAGINICGETMIKDEVEWQRHLNFFQKNVSIFRNFILTFSGQIIV
jgi:hypothetical protein